MSDLTTVFAELRARIGHWRRHALNVDTDLEADFAEWFGLAANEAKILAALYLAEGSPCTERQLEGIQFTDLRTTYPTRSIAGGYVRVRIHRVRTAMEPEAIDSAKGRGYWLTDAGLAECRQAIETLSLPPVPMAFGDAA